MTLDSDFGPQHLCFDSTGQFLVGADYKSDHKRTGFWGVLKWWGVVTRQAINDIVFPNTRILQIGFRSDGRLLVAMAPDGLYGRREYLEIFEVHLDTAEKTLVCHIQLARPTFIHTTVFNPSGQYLAYCTEDDVTIWNLETQQMALQLATPVEAHHVLFTSDGQHLIIADFEGHIHLWGIPK